jgi:hypothetical protein
MPKIIAGLLCGFLISTLGGSSGAAPNEPAAVEESGYIKRFLNCSNDVMVASLGLEIRYKQIPANRLQIASIKTGAPSSEIRNYLTSFARLTITNPLKTNNTVLPPGNYNFGLQEDRTGSGNWFFYVIDPSTGRQFARLDPVFDTLNPAMCVRVMTMEIDRKPGTKSLKIKMKWGDLSVTTRDVLEL